MKFTMDLMREEPDSECETYILSLLSLGQKRYEDHSVEMIVHEEESKINTEPQEESSEINNRSFQVDVDSDNESYTLFPLEVSQTSHIKKENGCIQIISPEFENDLHGDSWNPEDDKNQPLSEDYDPFRKGDEGSSSPKASSINNETSNTEVAVQKKRRKFKKRGYRNGVDSDFINSLIEATYSEKKRRTYVVMINVDKKRKREALKRRSHVIKPYICTICNKGFIQKGRLTSHLRLHNDERQFTCTICGKLMSRGNIGKHMRIHNGERPYSCSICDKSFTQVGHLRSHLRTHTGEKPYKCEVCDGRFTQNGNLTAHMRLHSGEKPYECSICNKVFSRKGNLGLHMRVHKLRKS